MASDVEPAGSQALDDATAEKQPAAEQRMGRTLVKAVVVSVPLGILIFVGLVALAIRDQDPNWAAWLGMAAGIGVLAGAFFGMLAGFIMSAHLFDD